MLDLVIVGSGPAGLSCAIEAKKAGLSVIVVEKGSLVDALRRFPANLVWFSTPELLEIGDVPFVTSTVRPSRVDTVNYYQRVTRRHGLDIRYHDAVVDIRKEDAGFSVITMRQTVYRARYVVLATGYFDNPNRLHIPGEDLPKVRHYYDEPFRYFDADVAVVGGRNSAVEASLDLFRHDVRVTLIHRGAVLSKGVKYWMLPDIENRIAAGQIRALFDTRVKEIRTDSLLVSTGETTQEIKNDFLFVLIGFSPEVSNLRRFGVEIEPDTLAPVHDPSTFETNVRGLYVAGSLVGGKNNNKVFVENGRLHGAVIVASIIRGKE